MTLTCVRPSLKVVLAKPCVLPDKSLVLPLSPTAAAADEQLYRGNDMKIFKTIVAAIAVAGAAASVASPAAAGDYNGDFMVRVQGTYLLTDDNMKSATLGGADISALVESYTTNSVLPTATLTYFLNKNVAVELFCCFATSNVKLKGAVVGEVGDTWMFPPALTLQYHFDGMGGFKPYLGIGAQWIHFFSEDIGALGGTKLKIDDAFGLVLQAGFDMQIGGGWYLNADVKKSFLDTTVTAYDFGGPGVHAVVDHELDPWVFSVGIGYRFNLFGPRYTEPLK